MSLSGVERVVKLKDQILAYGSQSMPIFEFNSDSGKWEEFVPEIGILSDPEYVTIPDWMLTVIPLETTHHLRFIEGQGSYLPYGYIGYREFVSGTGAIIRNWYAEDPICDEESFAPYTYESIHKLYHGRLRGVVRPKPGIISERFAFAIIDIPIEVVDHASSKLIWTGDSQYMAVLLPWGGSPPNGQVLHNRNLDNLEWETRSWEDWIEILQSMPEGASVIFGIYGRCPVHPNALVIPDAIRRGELINLET
jgi:hypothetical protein